MLPISVITCAHNPRPEYLSQVLEALKHQTLDQTDWEYLLIDNASTQPLAESIDLSWHPNARHVREEQLGLTPARLRGIREARGKILVFVDDDNVLAPDYLEQAIAVEQKHPTVGAFGGQRFGRFEVEPPAWTRRHWSHLALHEFEDDHWSNQPHLTETMPNGAGLCVRKQVADFYFDLHAQGKRAFLMDRNGGSLVSGGDIDLATCACDLGMGVGLFAALKLDHLIPAERLKEDYLLRLTEGIGYSAVILASFRNGHVGAKKGWTSKAADMLRYLRMDASEKRIYRAHRRGQEAARADLQSKVSAKH